MTNVRPALLALTLVLLVACSSDDDSATTIDDVDIAESAANTDSAANPSTTSTERPQTSAASDGDARTSAATTIPARGEPTNDGTAAPATNPEPTTVAVVDGAEASIELLTPTAGSGIRPLLEWASVERASYYTVVVHAPDGATYWSWTGAETAVHVGGDPVLDDDRPGPSVIDGMTWGVVALDENIVPIAYSERRSISP